MAKFMTKVAQKETEKKNSDLFADWRTELHDKHTFIVFPQDLLFHSDLTDGEIMFYQRLFALSDKYKGTLTHSNDTLSEKCGCTINNIKYFLKKLKEKQAIEVASTGPHSKRVICLTPWRLSPFNELDPWKPYN